MRHAGTTLSEFDHEIANTRRVLESVPDEKLDWRADATFNTIGWNANHLAEIVGWMGDVLTTSEFDMAPVGGDPYESPRLASREKILALFDANVMAARQALSKTDDEAMAQPWSLLHAGQTLFKWSRAEVIRSIILNHMIHHRAHLCVYLRLQGIELPEMYWPGADG